MIKLKNPVIMDEPTKSGANQKKIGSTCKTIVDMSKLDDQLRKKCISISLDLHNMNSADRLAFMYDEPGFPMDEKLFMLDTCIKVLEEFENYEMCATLHRMRTGFRTN
jgi:hypothetical protein